MRINESFSNIIMVALNPSKFAGLSSNQKIVAAIALSIFSIFTVGGVAYCLKKRKIGIKTPPNREIKTTPGRTSSDGSCTTVCYDLLREKMGKNAESFFSFISGFRNEDFQSLYRGSKKNGMSPIIVPRLDFLTSPSFNPEETKWIEWIIAYSGGIHRRAWGTTTYNIAKTHFVGYVKLLMRMPNKEEMTANIVSIVKKSSGGDYQGVDDLRRCFVKTCKENWDDPDVLNFARLIAKHLPDYMNL